MTNKTEIIRSFRRARIDGERLLTQGKIRWDEYAFSMIGFEIQLKSMGEDL
jgi:hypothetical protein